jgi:DNA polymerase-1
MILIFDGNNQAHMAYHSTGQNLINGTSFGLLRMMKATMAVFPDARPVFVWDGGLNKHRVELHPEYKKREGVTTTAPREEKEAFYEQIKMFELMLEMLGIPQLRMKGQEADDLIGIITKDFEEKGEQVVIVSTDNDFHQLVSGSLSLYNPIRKTRFTYDDFQKRYPDITPEQFVWVKSIMGDKSDNIPGVNGLGEKRALEIIQTVGDLDNLPDERLTKRGKTFARINDPDNIALVRRNYQLIGIDRANRIGAELPPEKEARLDDFFSLMRELDFRSVLNQEENWRKTFSTNGKKATALDFF